MDSFVPCELDQGRRLEEHSHTVPSMLSPSYNTAGIDYPELDLRPSPIDLDAPGQDFSSSFSSSIDGNLLDVEPFLRDALSSPGPRLDLTLLDYSSTEASFSSTESPRSISHGHTGQNLESLAWVRNQDTSHDEPSHLQKTTFTMENLDPDTRAQILDILFKRRVSTTIAIND